MANSLPLTTRVNSPVPVPVPLTVTAGVATLLWYDNDGNEISFSKLRYQQLFLIIKKKVLILCDFRYSHVTYLRHHSSWLNKSLYYSPFSSSTIFPTFSFLLTIPLSIPISLSGAVHSIPVAYYFLYFKQYVQIWWDVRYSTYLLRDGSGRGSSSVTSRLLRRVLQTFTGSVSVISCPGLGIGVEAEVEVEVGRWWSSGSCPSVSRVRHAPVKNTFTFLVLPFTLVTSVEQIYRSYE